MSLPIAVAALAHQNVAQSTQTQEGPIHNSNIQNYGPQQQPPTYQVYGQPYPTAQYQPYLQQPYQPQYQPYQVYPQGQQYVPFDPPSPGLGTTVPVAPMQCSNQHGQQGGFWSNEKMDFGIPEQKLITETLDISVRHGFVRKVYAILSVQLLVTFGLAFMFNIWKGAGSWLYANWWLMWVAAGVTLVGVIVLTCVPGAARAHPWNLMMLLLISIAFGVLLGYACVAVGTSSFAIAAGVTAGVAVSLSLFACQTKWDFTGCGVFVFVTMMVLMIFGLLMIFIRSRIVHLVYASIGTLLFSFYMVYDTQQIVGGKHRKFQYSIDDYVFAALTLYMDVINLFMYILTIVSATNE